MMEVTMLATFTTLAHAFCAAIISAGPADLVAVGYLSSDRCFVQVEAVRNMTQVINGHDISVEIIEGGAVVGVDSLRFIVLKASSV
jgi:hypothetical protein